LRRIAGGPRHAAYHRSAGFLCQSFYNVRITPAANDQTIVSGTLTPSGATVNLSRALAKPAASSR
jgi:hypothetical protein